MFYRYPKIETLYERDNDGTHRLIEGKFRNSAMEYLKDNYWIGTEKIDGMNIQVVWNGDGIEIYGRSERAQIKNDLMDLLKEVFASNEAEELMEQMFGNKPMVFYGEGYGAGIQNGGLYGNHKSFILFDVYAPESNTWLEREAVESIGKAFNVPVVPIIVKGTLDVLVKYVKTQPKSQVAENGAYIEGVVARPLVGLYDRRGNRCLVKIKVRDFIEESKILK